MSKREKNLLFVVVILLVIMAYALWILPIGTKTAELQSETELLQAEKEQQDMKLSVIPTLESSVAEKTEKLAAMKATLGNLQTQEEIATYFTDLAEAEALEMTSLWQTRSTALLESNGLNQLPMAEVTLSCRGGIEGFTALVDNLNQRDDITVLSLIQTETEETPEFTLVCLLLMQDN